MLQESNKKEHQPPSSTVSKKRKSAREEKDILTCVLNVMKNPPPVIVILLTTMISLGKLCRAKEMLKLKIQQLLVEAEFKEDQLVANRMTSLWPGQYCRRH